MNEAAITLNEATRRFELHTGGHTAYLEFEPVPGGLAFTHTIVPRALEGQGIGSRLVRHALDWAVAGQHKVRPDCSFVRTYIQRHPEYQAHALA
ncbi:MAG: GNAT family N-acetyltransferase [Pseudomonadota bacterium]|nr:GNAT family N-acetyltransferase [Pseudomonadota bacterium]